MLSLTIAYTHSLTHKLICLYIVFFFIVEMSKYFSKHYFQKTFTLKKIPKRKVITNT